MFEELEESGVRLQALPFHKELTPLAEAINKGVPEIVEYMIASGFKLNTSKSSEKELISVLDDISNGYHTNNTEEIQDARVTQCLLFNYETLPKKAVFGDFDDMERLNFYSICEDHYDAAEYTPNTAFTESEGNNVNDSNGDLKAEDSNTGNSSSDNNFSQQEFNIKNFIEKFRENRTVVINNNDIPFQDSMTVQQRNQIFSNSPNSTEVRYDSMKEYIYDDHSVGLYNDIFVEITYFDLNIQEGELKSVLDEPLDYTESNMEGNQSYVYNIDYYNGEYEEIYVLQASFTQEGEFRSLSIYSATEAPLQSPEARNVGDDPRERCLV
ncbi:hypothetical protein D7Z54_29730 [Salibacterium salarium]|uniref:Uncharacterized protein n=1 Tax=Salibacterium salarium TaxID=284579 RepID=A0A3R9QNC5_9BACI|nr:hypothetical protein [Salibacterium salarium]RSL29711.1 hypothetical protein D7Z54_29730 [Salibacterium salarium]